MHFDPSHMHDKPTKVRLDEVADDLLTAMARYQRTQKAVLAREILERGLNQMMEELTARLMWPEVAEEALCLKENSWMSSLTGSD